MKNICIFTNTLLNGGAEKQAMLLTKALNTKYKVWLIVYYGEKVEQKFNKIIDDNQIRAIFLLGSHTKKIYELYKFLKEEKISILFSYLLTTNFIGGVLGKYAGVNYTIGGIRSSKLAPRKEFLQKLIQNHINDKTIYNNNKGYKVLSSKGFCSSKAVVIPNCFELETIPLKREEHRSVKIISVGRFHIAKDYKTAIRAVSILRRYNNNFIYQIIGYGIEECNIRNWIDEFSAQDYIEIVINPENLNEYYKAADIYLMTSIFEGLSNTVMEAMSFSLPLIITDVGDNDMLVVDGENGYLCDVGDVIQISERLEVLLNSYEKRIKLGLKSYEILSKNYSYEKFQRNYFDFIENINEVK